MNNLAKAIREKTQEGLQIAEYMYGVFNGTIEPDKNRVAAATWLADYGFPKPDNGEPSAGQVAVNLLHVLVTMPPEFVTQLNERLIAASGQVVDVTPEEK